MPHRLGVNILKYQVAPHEKAVTMGNSVYSGQSAIDTVLARQRPTIQPGRDTSAGCGFDQHIFVADATYVDIALISAVLKSFTISDASKNVRLGDTDVAHSLV